MSRAAIGVPYFLLWIAASALSASPAARKTAANDQAPASFRLVSITARGSNRYTPEQIVAASGLQTGEMVSEDDFKHATEQLGETGAFSEVVYSYQYSGAGAKLEFQVSDAKQFVPVKFDNFVWFSDEELQSKLRSEVPMFQGELPVAGNLADQVSNALQTLLIERGINGKADYLRSGTDNGPINAILFSVSGPRIAIRNTSFPGAGEAELPQLEAAGKKLGGQDYLRSSLQAQAEKSFVPVYLQRGYLKASFGRAEAKVVQSSSDETVVDVSFAVEPGKQYKLGKVTWSGNSVLPTTQLQSALHGEPGQPANAVQLGDDLEAVKKLYGARGYVAATVHPQPQFDEATATVSYALQVHEGDQYHMGELDIQGLDRTTTNRLLLTWQLKQDQPYDSSYPKRFLDEAFKSGLVGEGWNISVHESPDLRSKTVDVTIRFDSKR